MIINITEVCRLRCVGCYAPKLAKSMTMEQFRRIIHSLPKGVETITLSGGEPLLHPLLFDFVDFCNENNIRPRIVTSGFEDTDYTLLKDKVDLITVTIKSPNDKEDSEWKLGRPDGETYIKAIETLERLKFLEIPRAINWVADKKNKKSWLAMVRLAQEYDAYLQVIRFIPYQMPLIKYDLSNNEWERLCKTLDGCNNVHIAFPSKVSYQVCTAGLTRMNVHANGDVTPCIYSNEVVGNIFEESYSKIEKKLEKWRVKYKYNEDSLICKILIKIAGNPGLCPKRKGCIAYQNEGRWLY